MLLVGVLDASLEGQLTPASASASARLSAWLTAGLAPRNKD